MVVDFPLHDGMQVIFQALRLEEDFFVKNGIAVPSPITYLPESTLNQQRTKNLRCRDNFFFTDLYESFGKDVPNTSYLISVFFAMSWISSDVCFHYKRRNSDAFHYFVLENAVLHLLNKSFSARDFKGLTCIFEKSRYVSLN